MKLKYLAAIAESATRVSLPSIADLQTKPGVERLCRDLAKLVQVWGRQIHAVRQAELVTATQKSDRTIVTLLDPAVEDSFRSLMQRNYGSDVTVIGEERANDFKPEDISGLVAILDPIDGTTNFYREGLTYCISMCMLWNGMPYLGIIYMPAMRWGIATTFLSGGKNLMPRSFPKNIAGKGRERESVKVSEFIVGIELSSDNFEPQFALFGEVQREIKIACQRRAKLRNRGTSALNGLTAGLGAIDLYYQIQGKAHDLLPPACIAHMAGASVLHAGGDFFPISAERLQAGIAGNSATAGMDIVIGYEPYASRVAQKIADFKAKNGI